MKLVMCYYYFVNLLEMFVQMHKQSIHFAELVMN